MVSYREWPFRQLGVARMYSRRIPRGPLGSLGDRKTAEAHRKTEILPSNLGHTSIDTWPDGTHALG